MEPKPRFNGISPEGIAVDAAIDALTVEVWTGNFSVDEAKRVAGEILRTEVGVKATEENNAAVAEFLKKVT